MINNAMKLLMSAFVVLLLGLVLIQPLADDIGGVSNEGYTVFNESVSLTTVTATHTNESNKLNLTNDTTLAPNHITTVTEIRNITSEIVTSQCNITLPQGVLECNETSLTNEIYVDYTYNDTVSGKLAYDEIISFTACRDSLMYAVTIGIHCNITAKSGDLIGRYDNFTVPLAYVDYTYDTDTYVRSSTARTLLRITILFFALAILSVGIGFAIKAFKDGGIM